MHGFSETFPTAIYLHSLSCQLQYEATSDFITKDDRLRIKIFTLGVNETTVERSYLS